MAFFDRLRAGPLGSRDLHLLPSCDSTNRQAREALVAGRAAPGSLFVTELQRAGRGRLGRIWSAAPGQNLLFSLVLAPDLPVARLPRCVLLWAAAMAETLGVWLKWPNDLIDGQDRKLGGILAELEGDALVLGVGINVNQREFSGLPQATSLAHLRGAPLDRAALLAALIEAIEAIDLHGTLDPWRARARTLGRQVRVAGAHGLAHAIREDGALLVGDSVVVAGDVELLS